MNGIEEGLWGEAGYTFYIPDQHSDSLRRVLGGVREVTQSHNVKPKMHFPEVICPTLSAK